MRNLLIGAIVLMGAASCNNEMERHELTQLYPTNVVTGRYVGSLHYPGMTLDSLAFYTFDSYKLSTSSDFITIISEKEKTLPYDFNTRYYISASLRLDDNLTGKMRAGVVTISLPSLGWSSDCVYYQTGWQNVLSRGVEYEYDVQNWNNIPVSARFSQTDSAHWTTDTLAFQTYGMYTLSVKDAPEWIKLGGADNDGALRGNTGYHRVDLVLKENDTELPRTAVLQLTSCDVTTDVIFTQLGAKK